jgi:hypothetical protein
MIRKLLLLGAVAGFLMAVSTEARQQSQNGQQDQQAPKVHSITGKVTQVESGGRAFSMDVNLGSDKHPMRFVVDKSTMVQGHVAAGTTASVDFQSDASGQLVALSVKEESPQSK